VRRLAKLLAVSLLCSLHAAAPALADSRDAPWAFVTSAGLRTLAELPEASRAELLSCALGPGESASACVRVMTVLAGNRPELARVLREVLRGGASEAAVAEAAAAMAELPDLAQNDLVLLALLTGRGGADATPYLVRAYLGSDPPWVRYYLRLLAREAATPLGRAVAAENALAFAKRRELLLDLIGPLSEAQGSGEHRALANRLAAFGRTLRVRCAEPGRHNGLNESCLETARVAVDQASSRSGRPDRFAPPRAETRKKALAGRALPRADFYRELALAGRFAPIGFATSASLATLGDDAGTPARRAPPPPPGAPPHAPVGSYAPSDLPPDFWGFDPGLSQPSWYPRHLHLTIDDGPRPEVLGPTLDVLERHGVRATFFFVGSALIRQRLEGPDRLRTLLDRVVSGGHAVGYHSMNHEVLPALHESEREADQLADSVTLYRWLLARFVGRPVMVRHGRFPGGRGAFDEAMPRLYREAGLLQHVFWNFGPGFWVQNTPTHEVAGMACPLAASPEAVVVLLHEFPMLPHHFEALFSALKRCPPPPPTTTTTPTPSRAHWRKDRVFTSTLCDAPHPDLVRLCALARAQPGSPGDGQHELELELEGGDESFGE
jgi:peptidoglycan/xylan/chitin deacetylase (PgdA/CDA1 family)